MRNLGTLVAVSEKVKESYRDIDEMDQFCQEFGNVTVQVVLKSEISTAVRNSP